MFKVGYTARTFEQRIAEHYRTTRPGVLPYEAQEIDPAIRSDGSMFMDHAVFTRLKAHGINYLRAADGTLTEWVKCSIDDIKNATSK